MWVIQAPARWLMDLVVAFPLAVQPGLFVAFVVLIGWLLLRRGRVLWRFCVRMLCQVTDVTLGLVLLAEYQWTQRRRRAGMAAAQAALTGGQVAERILDGVAVAYLAPGPAVRQGRVRTPVIWGVIFCAVSVTLYWVELHATSGAPGQVAARVWHYWATIHGWAFGG
jgi:hypothetical protein